MAFRIGPLPRTKPQALAWIAVAVTGLFAAVTLSRALGMWSTFVAACLWGIAVAGIAYVEGHLSWVGGYPALARALDYLVGHYDSRAPERPAAAGVRSSAATPAAAPEPGAGRKAVKPNLALLEGGSSLRETLENLVLDAEFQKQAKAGALCVFLVGPHGVGKTSCANYLAARLSETGIVKSPQVVTISDTELPGLAETTWQGENAMTEASARMQEAPGKVLILEDIDHLVKTGTDEDGGAIEKVGVRLRKLANDHPGRVLIIATVTEDAWGLLDPRKRWLNTFTRRSITIPALNSSQRVKLAERLLDQRGYGLTAAARNVLKASLDDFGKDPANLDNAHAVRRLVDSIVDLQKLHVIESKREGDALADPRRIEADIVRGADGGIGH